MWYYCLDCGHLFEDGEESEIVDVLDVIDGQPYVERRKCCPECGGDFDRAETCVKCGEVFNPDKLIGRLYCRTCFADILTDANMKRYVSESQEDFAEWAYMNGV